MFMYLHLYSDDQDGVNAKITNDGQLEFSSLGTANTRNSRYPIAVFQLNSFTGLPNIDDDDLLAEIIRRYTTKELFQRLQINLSIDDLIDMLKDRIRDDA